MEYPTINGIAVPAHEIGLPDSKLNLSNERNLSNHHRAWTRRNMAKSSITQMFRDLEGMQEILPHDVHGKLHELYGPPKPPTPQQAMTRIAMGFYGGESMKIFSQEDGFYIYKSITMDDWLRVNQEYGRVR